MNYSSTSEMSFDPRQILAVLLGVIATVLVSSVANAQIDGFTEPFKAIELSSDETGSIAELKIEDGMAVSAGDVVACLDSRVQELQLEIATQSSKSDSQRRAAAATLQKRRMVAERLRDMVSKGHARDSELLRAELELSLAEAKVLASEEAKIVQEIEMRRAQVLLDRRCIKAPFDGVIAKVHRQEGEYLSPLRPEIATLVQTDRLLATFMIPSSQVRQFEVGTTYEITLENGQVVEGAVHQVGVLTDAQSGTVVVKLVIENQSGEFRSGEICSLSI